MSGWLAKQPARTALGRRTYALDTYGVTVADLEPIFDGYLSAFDIELEGV